MLWRCLKGIRRRWDSDPPREDPAPRAIFPIHEMLEAAARFIPSPMETTFLMTGASVHVAAARPAVATPAVGSIFCRRTGLTGTAANAREAGFAICNHLTAKYLSQIIAQEEETCDWVVDNSGKQLRTRPLSQDGSQGKHACGLLLDECCLASRGLPWGSTACRASLCWSTWLLWQQMPGRAA